MRWLLALCSSALYVLAFPQLGWWPLVFVAAAPLMVGLAGQGARTRFLMGWLTGFGFTLGMQYWIAGTLVSMSDFPWPLAILGLAGYAAYVGLLHALFALLYTPVRRLSGRLGWLCTVPLLYAVVERLFPSLFPLYICSALYRAPILLQGLEWVGPSGMTALVLVVSCGLVHVTEEIARGRASDYFVPTAVTAGWLMLTMWGMVRMEQVWSAPVRGEPTIALVQPNVTTDEKKAPDPRVREEVYARTSEMTRSAMALRPNLIVWAEGGFPFYFRSADRSAEEQEGEGPDGWSQVYTKEVYRLALELGVDLVAGALRREGGQTRNSAVHFMPHTERARVYDKRQLLLFGERVPFAETFPALRTAIPGMSHFAAGTRFQAFEVAGFRFVPSICYEALEPESTRQSLETGRGGDILLNLTNDVWFGDTAEPEQHLMAQLLRSIENRVWLVRSTNSGISGFIDPTGTIRATSEVGSMTVLGRSIAVPALERSFYRKHGDLLFWAGVCLALVLLIGWNGEALGKLLRRRGVSGGSGAAEEPAPPKERRE